LNSRFVIIQFGVSDRQPNTKRTDIFDVQKMNICKEVYEKYLEYGEKINDMYDEVL
jgi:hypothetical protein